MTTTDGKIIVIVDDRERNSSVPEALARTQAFDARIKRLPAGDYRVDGRFLFERKTLPDFAASLISGRLFEGAAADPANRIPSGAGAGRRLLRIAQQPDPPRGRAGSADHGIRVHRSAGAAHARSRGNRQNVSLHGATGPYHDAWRSAPAAAAGPKARRRCSAISCRGLPGIGAKRAADLLAHFSTVEEVFTVDEAALTAVPGIGRDTARKIRRAVREEAAGYRIGFKY